MKLLWFLPAIIGIAFICTAFGGDGYTDRPNGSPGGYTGSPGDGHTCTACHGGSASNVTGWITSNVPAEGYTPGTTYTITAIATGSGGKGFEISPQSPSGSLLGTLAPGSGNKLCNGSKAVTQSSTVSGSSATWTFSWTAPAAGTGAVTFYGAFTVTEPVTKLCTMVVNEHTTIPLSAIATAAPEVLCEGQSTQLSVAVTGGNPPYTFSWTSVPAGFTSSVQNPSVSPTVTTTYNVQVGDGTNSASSSVTVTVNHAPTAEAGIDTTYCKDVADTPCYGDATNSSAIAWTTSGDGTFTDGTLLNSVYHPGTGDHTTGSVDITLTVSPMAPCASSATSVRHLLFDPCTGISNDQGRSSVITISPNPTEGLIHIDFSGVRDQNTMVTVYNNQGKQVLSQNIGNSGNSVADVDLSGLAAGLYYVKVQTSSVVNVQKVILH